MTRRRGSLPSFDWTGDDDVATGEAISPVQCRMARAGLVMSVRELARLAEVSGLTVTRFENGNEACPAEMVLRFRRILESRGARFVPKPGGDGVLIGD